MGRKHLLTQRTWESAALFTLAFEITKLLHELAHALMARVLDRRPVLFHDHVDCALDGTVLDRVATSAAGPLWSGLSGLVFAVVATRVRSLPATIRLFVLWLGYHGVVNLVGYLFTTWFAAGGDIGKIARLLQLPTFFQIALTAAAGWSFRYLPAPFAASFAELSPVKLTSEAEAKAFAREIGLYAGLIATPVVVLSHLPVPHWVALIYAAMSAMPLLDLPNVVASKRHLSATTPLGTARPFSAWLMCALVVLSSRWLLSGGVPLG